jgi:hypothetical protein
MFILKCRSIRLQPAAVLLLFALTLFLSGKTEAAQKQVGKSRKPAAAKPGAAIPSSAFSTADTGNCAGCHAAYMDSMNADNTLLFKHKDAVTDCFTCHGKADLQAKHANVTKAPGKVFRQRKYPDGLCLNCHDGYEKLVEKTKNSRAFTTTDGRAINPHNVESLGGTHEGKKDCSGCHKMHKAKPPIEYCFGCHHPRELSNCKICHGRK